MRVKGGVVTRRRHKKVLKATKGYRMTKHNLYKVAHEAYLHAGQYSYDDRRKRHGSFARIWIVRINAALKPFEIKYSVFKNHLKQKKVQLNNHVLSELAVSFPETFKKVVEFVK